MDDIAENDTTKDEGVRLTLRLPKHLHETIQGMARTSSVSLNTCLISLLSERAALLDILQRILKD